MIKDTGIYIHIPFCIQKCKYCDFLSFDMNTCTKANEENIEKYFKALWTEIRATAALDTNSQGTDKGQVIKSIFFGGGTPSMVDSKYIVETLSTIYKCFSVEKNVEITIECNPGTVTLEKLKAYKECGINRISIGLQSANDHDLKVIGRIHTFEQFLESYTLVTKAGFDNVNIDVMSALPYQTFEAYVESLEKIIALKPTHISAYSLILEEDTPLYDMVNADGSDMLLPSEEDEREMYYKTAEILKANGYEQYEISNFAKADYHCKHNCLYWNRGQYFGFGLGASSYINNVRYKNISDFGTYIENSSIPASIHTEETPITKDDSMSEFMYLGLRFIEGVNANQFSKEFGLTLEDVFGEEIKKLLSLELLEKTDIGYRLTKYGIDVSNYAMSFFV